MSFFDDLKPPRWEPEQERDAPEWSEPPAGWLGGMVPSEVMLARSEEAVVFVRRITAYPAGFSFDLEAHTRGPRAVDVFQGYPHRMGTGDEFPPELLRFGIEYADGRRTAATAEMAGGTILRAFDPDEPDPDPDRDLLLSSSGGSANARRQVERFWAWPLPPAGVVTFHCEWPALDIPESSAMLDAAGIRAAADRARALWD